jgi:hypothetical protein
LSAPAAAATRGELVRWKYPSEVIPGPSFSKVFSSAETEGPLAIFFPGFGGLLQEVVILRTRAKTINPAKTGKIFFIVAMYSLLAMLSR